MAKESDPAAPASPEPRGAVASALAPVLREEAGALDADATPDAGLTAARLRFEQEQSYYNELYLLAPVGYFLIGFDTTILQVNLVGADMLGILRSACASHHFRSFVAASFIPDFDCFIARSLNCSKESECRLKLVTGTGVSLPVTLRASCDGSGQACRVIVERAEGKVEALERSEERLRRIVHTAEEGIWEIDAMSRTSFVNPKMAQILGYPIEEMLGRPLADFMDAEGRSLMEINIERRQQGICERHEFKFQHRDGHAVWTTIATNPIFDAAGNYTGALALVTDITAARAAAPRQWREASFDALTGLPNRHMFMHRLEQEARKADRSATFLALLLVELDQFEDINQRFGRAMGDQVLVETTRRIASCVRATDTVARLGGDRFGVILSGQENVGSVERIARAMLALMALPFDLNGQKATLSASSGIALYPPDATGLEQLLERAGQALHAARHSGRNRLNYYTPELQQAAASRESIGADLREALAKGQFEILYQPIVALQTGQVHKAEALLRWHHPTRGVLSPAEFIPFAETSGLIVEIGDWVFREAARQAKRWQQLVDPAFQISINKSPLQFRRDAELYEGWLAYLTELGLRSQSIIIEITESVLMGGVEQVIERLRQYRALGLQVALDDFGTGYASLSHLKRFDLDFVKIDQSFVATLEDEHGDLPLCQAMIAMAHTLGLKVVAEGVETKAQRALLLEAGCDYAQGYMFARPMAASEFEAMAVAAVPELPH